MTATDKEFVFPHAKINIGLFVTRKREDGYHILQTLFYPIDWCDGLEALPHSENGVCKLHTSGIVIDGPTDNNLIVKAYNLMKSKFSDLPGVEFFLEKRIPFGAGMGGGSSDGAQALMLINKLFNLTVSQEEIEEMASHLGADCAFFCRSGAQYCKGLGFELSPYDLSLLGKWIVVIKPPFGVSTKEAYAHVVPTIPPISLDKLLQRPISEWKDCISNDFELSVFPQHPLLGTIKETLYAKGAVYAAMSGSGSAMFGIFDQEPENPNSWFEEFGCITKCTKALV